METQLGLKGSARTSSPLQLNSSMSCFVTSFIFRVTWLLCQKHHFKITPWVRLLKWHSEFLNKNTLYHSAQMEPPAQQDPVAPSNQRHNTKINKFFMPSRCTNLIQDLQVAPTLHRFHPCRFPVLVLQLSWFPAAEKRNLQLATLPQNGKKWNKTHIWQTLLLHSTLQLARSIPRWPGCG